MALDNHIDDREYDKFTTNEDGLATIRVKNFSGLSNGIAYDFIDAQQTSTTVRTYVYKTGGSGGTTVATITVVYTDTTRSDIDTITRT